MDSRFRCGPGEPSREGREARGQGRQRRRPPRRARCPRHCHRPARQRQHRAVRGPDGRSWHRGRIRPAAGRHAHRREDRRSRRRSNDRHQLPRRAARRPLPRRPRGPRERAGRRRVVDRARRQPAPRCSDRPLSAAHRGGTRAGRVGRTRHERRGPPPSRRSATRPHQAQRARTRGPGGTTTRPPRRRPGRRPRARRLRSRICCGLAGRPGRAVLPTGPPGARCATRFRRRRWAPATRWSPASCARLRHLPLHAVAAFATACSASAISAVDARLDRGAVEALATTVHVTPKPVVAPAGSRTGIQGES